MRDCQLVSAPSGPALRIEIDGVAMDFAYRDYFEPVTRVPLGDTRSPLPDRRLATLFQRADTVEAAWRAVRA